MQATLDRQAAAVAPDASSGREEFRRHRTDPNAAGGDEREKCRSVAGLRRDREVVLPEQPRRQRQALHHRRLHWHRDDIVEIGIAVQECRRCRRTPARRSSRPARRAAGCGSDGVVNNTSPSRRKLTTRIRGRGGRSSRFMAARRTGAWPCTGPSLPLNHAHHHADADYIEPALGEIENERIEQRADDVRRHDHQADPCQRSACPRKTSTGDIHIAHSTAIPTRPS